MHFFIFLVPLILEICFVIIKITYFRGYLTDILALKASLLCMRLCVVNESQPSCRYSGICVTKFKTCSFAFPSYKASSILRPCFGLRTVMRLSHQFSDTWKAMYRQLASRHTGFQTYTLLRHTISQPPSYINRSWVCC